MRKFAKRCLALLAAMVMLFALAGCNTKEQPQDLVTIELNEVTHSVFYAPQYAAMELCFMMGVSFQASMSLWRWVTAVSSSRSVSGK